MLDRLLLNTSIEISSQVKKKPQKIEVFQSLEK